MSQVNKDFLSIWIKDFLSICFKNAFRLVEMLLIYSLLLITFKKFRARRISEKWRVKSKKFRTLACTEFFETGWQKRCQLENGKKPCFIRNFKLFDNYFSAVLTVGGVILQNQSFYEKDDVGHLSFYEKDALVIF